MGQRTQILVVKENGKGEVKKTFWHHQWGYGRNMYLALMSLYIADYSKETFDKRYDFFKTAFPTIPGLYNITNDVPKKVLDAANINNLATIKRLFDYGDNNNGGMVVYIKEDPDGPYLSSDFKVGFLLGDEDKEENGEIAFSRWLTPAEYGSMNGGCKYSNKEFIEIVEKFCNYFGIKNIENNQTAEEVEEEYNELCKTENE